MIISLLLNLSITLTSDDIINAHSHLQFLSHDQLAGRKTATPHSQITANYIAAHFEQLGLHTLSQNFISNFTYRSGLFGEIKGSNVIASTNLQNNKPIVIITAHYDHLGKKGNKIFNGADDNASGVAALLILAKAIQRNKNSELNYVFLATDAEENGLFGAKAFIDNPPLDLKRILLNINLDMLGYSKKARLLALYNPRSRKFIDKLRENDWHASSRLIFTTGRGFYPRHVKSQRRRIINASDHSAFHKKRIAILYFGVGEHKHYHQVTDTYNNLHHAFYNGNLHNIAKVISQLDTHYQLIDRH